ncbi:lipid-binding SYLF domain-containing protein [Candidatus Methylacidiphilum fumarolicum]|nr:lipid-binding SYLF domain-containing protein [Candidatus Methylacidiphilum fumarolicum]
MHPQVVMRKDGLQAGSTALKLTVINSINVMIVLNKGRQKTKTFLWPIFCSLLFLAFPIQKLWAWNFEKQIDQVVTFIQMMKNRYKDNVPEPIFQEAKGIGFVSLYQASLFMKERQGVGLIIVRLPEGRWSGPLAVKVSGWDLGLSVGFLSADLLLVINTQETIDLLIKGTKCNIGVGQSAQPGLVELTEDQATSPTAAVYVYLISKKKLKGIAIGNIDLIADPETNWKYYQTKCIPYQILSGRIAVPESGQRLIQALLEPYRSLPVKPAERVVASPP